ncbi:hypothetical protein K439DRAFT_1632879 [Ramaria rubella]|nr:hypothetical protein K439DRAFT_1632879 [Ramaria rubella]
MLLRVFPSMNFHCDLNTTTVPANPEWLTQVTRVEKSEDRMTSDEDSLEQGTRTTEKTAPSG